MADVFDAVNMGAYDLRRTVLDFLKSELPPYLELMRQQHPEFDENTLPDPVYWDAYDPLTAKDYPAIGMYINGSDDYVMGDTNFTGSQTFTAVYDTTIFVSARTALLGTDDAGVTLWEQPERDSSMRIRDLYMAAVKAIIFDKPSFGTAGQEVGLTKLQRGTYKEIMVDPVTMNQIRWITTGVVTAMIEHTETTAPPILGYIHQVDTTIDLIDDSSPDVDPILMPDD